MAFTQRIQPGGDGRCSDLGHDPAGCAVIDCVTDQDVADPETGVVAHPAGTVVWHSHLSRDLDPAHRLNPDHPAEDHRGGDPAPVQATAWCEDCRSHPAAAAILA